MEENSSTPILDGKITGISFSLATRQEICLASISDCPITHVSQLSNPFLGLPLEVGKCESCGTAEPGKCEGHFGYIELPIPIYHPSHISELKRILSLICLKCLKFKNKRLQQSENIGVLERVFAVCCEEVALVTVHENQKKDGACFLELKLPGKSKPGRDFWGFLDRYGYRYSGDGTTRALLPSEVLKILKKIPEATKKKLAGRGCYFQEGYIMQHLPVPPNCLSTPDVSDGITVTQTDISMPMLKKVLRQVEIIKSSRLGTPNFESLETEVNDLQSAVALYLQSRGAKSSPDRNTRYAIARTATDSSSTKAWLEKMKTLFISKGSGFSSRSVITGDPYKRVGEIGIPFEIAQRITFEERVTDHNIKFLQKLVDEKLCLTYRDGQSTYSLREGSKGHTFLKPGQVVHRKIMEGDVIFINRPPTTHKHSLQALSVYIHDDHTFKINPIICGPLSADFDGDCIHIFYPQSPEAKAEVLELFAVEKQLLSSHSGNVNLQLGADSVLSLKNLFKKYFFTKAQVQQLALFTSNQLAKPSMLKARECGPLWTVLELLQTSLPRGVECSSERFVIRDSVILKLDYSREAMQSIINEIISSIFFSNGPEEVLKLFNSLQPMLMEHLDGEGFDLSLEDFIVSKDDLRGIEEELLELSPLLHHLRSNYNEVIDTQLETRLRASKTAISNFILKISSMGDLIDPKSESALTRIVQQIGFLGLQIYERGRLYSRTLAEDLSSHFVGNYPFPKKYPFEEFGLIRSCLFHGLDPYQEMVHSVASREVMVRSSRGLTEPGILFKNSMAILRDVVICYDGTVRNVCSNSVIQFEYGAVTQNLFAAGEPVGVLAATAMSNPAYKAVLDSSPSSNNSWNMMKEILQCGVNFKNVHNDRRVVLYLNDCDCGAKYCLENAAFMVKNHLRKVSLKDMAVEFLIEYKRQQTLENAGVEDVGLVGHIHLNKTLLKESNISMEEILKKCEETLNSFRKKKKGGHMFQNIDIACNECSFQQSSKWTPCLKFFWHAVISDIHLENTVQIFADTVCPVLLNTVIKGDPRVKEATITWISPETTVWIKDPSKDQRGDLAIDIVLEKEAVKKNGDAWRTVMDACLPVIHLIDTRRSIPYAIKQVEHLLGIACTFEQAVQRLSTSVSMVTKGMLKEHLLLLASSMTCAGFLIGFNLGGIKALNKTLNFQVPFSEATVYTPKRCFEKAAEKCHADSLSSIVGSCSWGKPVAVGTGSRFDILWDTREVELSQKEGIDVYNFLHLVQGGTEQADSGCLGGEVDSFDLEDNYMERGSPEIESGLTKPAFEEDLNLVGMDVDQTGWGTSSAPDDGGGWGSAVKATPAAGGGGGWGEAKSDEGKQTGSWGGWGAKKNENETGKGSGGEQGSGSGWGAKTIENNNGSGSGWGEKAVTTDEPAWGSNKNGNDTGMGSGSAWGPKAVTTDEPAWGSKKNESDTGTGSGAAWGQKAVTTNEPAWGSKKNGNDTGMGSGSAWGPKAVTTDEPAWGSKKNESDTGTGSGAAWGQKAVTTNEPAWGSKKNGNDTGMGSGSGWGQEAVVADEPGWGAKKKENASGVGSGSGWGQKAVVADEPGWGAKKKENDSGLGSGSGWGQKVVVADEPGWGAKKKENDSGGGAGSGWGQKAVVADEPGWGGKKSEIDTSKGAGSGWGQKAVTTDEPGWGAKKSDTDTGKGAGSSWGAGGTVQPAGEKEQEGSWGQKGSWKASGGGSSSSAWGKPVEKTDTPSTEPAGNDKWGSSGTQPEGSDWSKKIDEKPDANVGWGKKKDPEPATDGSAEPAEEKPGSWGWNRKAEQKADQTGWKKKENWGPKRDRPARPVGGPNDGPRPPLTATRQRLDSFTAEEQEILSEIEPIMLSIRRIMSQTQTGYIDGDPLPADDQKYILENVFTHHPDKDQKAGVGVDYIMITKHVEFQDTRCFFVVSTDGRKEDFSYRKCLENFVRAKYPDKVGEFIPKYFRKIPPRPPMNRDEAGTPRSRGGWNRESRGAGDEAGTPGSQSGWKRENSQTADESATPASGWQKEANTGNEGGGAVMSGWQKEASTTQEAGVAVSGWKKEAGTPASGWPKEATTAPEGGAAAVSGWKKDESTPPEGGAPAATGWGQAASGWNKEETTAPEGEAPAATGWGQAAASGGGGGGEGGSSQKSGWGS